MGPRLLLPYVNQFYTNMIPPKLVSDFSDIIRMSRTVPTSFKIGLVTVENVSGMAIINRRIIRPYLDGLQIILIFPKRVSG